MRNPYLCLVIVGSLGLCSLVGVVGMFALAYAGRAVPGEAIAIVAGAVGSLSSFLTRPPKGSAGTGAEQKGFQS